MTLGRYGVQVSYMKDETGQMKLIALASLPDFEGIMPGGRQVVFDCKVCNQASFPLDTESKSKSRQLSHLLKRGKFGAVAFYLVHFPERVLKTRTDPEETYAFPVHPDHPFWEAFERGEKKRITREDCLEYAVPVEWNVLPGGTKPRPDIVLAVMCLAGQT